MPEEISDLKEKSARIRELKSEALLAFKKVGFSDQVSAAPGSDIQVRGLFAGLNNLCVDLNAVAAAPKRALSISTATERSLLFSKTDELTSSLSVVASNLNSLVEKNFRAQNKSTLSASNGSETATPDLADLLARVDGLKTALRPFIVRFTSEHLAELEKSLDSLIRLSANAEASAAQIQADAESIETLKSDCVATLQLFRTAYTATDEVRAEAETKLVTLDELTANAKAAEATILKIKESVDSTQQTIAETQADIDSHREVVSLFSRKIAAREDQLAEQERKSTAFAEELEKIRTTHAKLIADAEHLISEARRALTISTEVSLGRHFADQYESEKARIHYWLVAAGACVATSLGLGIWAVFWPGESAILSFITRLSLVPITLSAAIFCAYQYSAQKRIVADYAYKKVLALSLTGFREYFSEDTPTDWKEIAPQVLAEIHTHPLTERSKKRKTEKVDLVDVVQKGSNIALKAGGSS